LLYVFFRSGHDGISNPGVPWRPMFSGSFTRGSEPTQLNSMSAATESDNEVVANATLAWLESGRGGLRWKQPLKAQEDILEELQSVDSVVVQSSASEKDRVTSSPMPKSTPSSKADTLPRHGKPHPRCSSGKACGALNRRAWPHNSFTCRVATSSKWWTSPFFSIPYRYYTSVISLVCNA
jgi:hypothetical protein